jgi:serine O-acetyltransferase
VTEPSLRQILRADIEIATNPVYRLFGARKFWTRAIGKLLISPNLRAVLLFRFSHLLAQHRLMPFALVLRARALGQTGAEIHPLATIGAGLHLVHSNGVVIGPDVVIGVRCKIHQGVTLGGPVHEGGGLWSGPKVGDDVMLGAHAVLLGNLTVGDRAIVGANSVVTRDVAADTTVAGAPARPI